MLKTNDLQFYRFWLTVGVALIGLVVFLSLGNPAKLPMGGFSYDKLGHTLAYFVLTGWFIQLSKRGYFWLWMLLFTAQGILLEYLQAMTPYRSFEYADMVANTSGALMALILATKTGFGSLLVRFEKRFVFSG